MPEWMRCASNDVKEDQGWGAGWGRCRGEVVVSGVSWEGERSLPSKCFPKKKGPKEVLWLAGQLLASFCMIC